MARKRQPSPKSDTLDIEGVDQETLDSLVEFKVGERQQFGIAVPARMDKFSSPDVKKPGHRDWIEE